MHVTDWTAIGGIVLVTLGMLCQALVSAWHFGRFREQQETHAERIDKLEEAAVARAASDVSLASKLGEIGANVVHLMADVATLRRDVH